MLIRNYAGDIAQEITNEALTDKKALSYTEKKALFGYLFEIWDNNHDLFMELGLDSVYALYDNCMIQNNELRFFCGEGIDLGNGERLDGIFLNKNDCLIFSVWDSNDNEKFYI